MKRIKKYMIGVLVVFSLVLSSCGTSYYSGSGYRSVDHYHYGMGGGWGTPYYGDEVIIIDDGIDIGMPDAVDYPMDDW
jgi:hypothetical protein